MFGSEVAGAMFFRELSLLTPVTATVGTKISNLSAAPLGSDFPLCLHYMETGNYSGYTSGQIDLEAMRYVVRILTPGESTNPIKKAAAAQFQHFKAFTGEIWYPDENDDLVHYGVESIAVGEWPLTTLQDGKTIYRCLGTFYTVNVTQYGV